MDFVQKYNPNSTSFLNKGIKEIEIVSFFEKYFKTKVNKELLNLFKSINGTKDIYTSPARKIYQTPLFYINSIGGMKILIGELGADVLHSKFLPLFENGHGDFWLVNLKEPFSVNSKVYHYHPLDDEMLKTYDSLEQMIYTFTKGFELKIYGFDVYGYIEIKDFDKHWELSKKNNPNSEVFFRF